MVLRNSSYKGIQEICFKLISLAFSFITGKMISLLVSIYFILLSFGSSTEAKNEKLDFIE